MEEQRPSGTIDNLEVSSPSVDNPVTDFHDEIGSASSDSLYSEEPKLSLTQRLAQAFREGVASAKPDYVKRPEVRIPPADRKRPPEPEDGGMLDRAVQGGGSAAAAVGDKAAVALDHVVQLAKKAPGTMHKYVQAFREGAASVKPREGAVHEVRPPRPAREIGSAFAGKAMLDRVLHSKASASEMLRDAIAAVKPSPVRGAWRKIRISKKRIHELYAEIGCEVAKAWADGPVETEKVTGLLNELHKNEEDIRKLTAYIAEVEAAKKVEAARKAEAARSQPAEKEVAMSPAPMPAPEPMEEADLVPPEEASAAGFHVELEESAVVEMGPVAPAEEHVEEVDIVLAEEASAGEVQAAIEEPVVIEMSTDAVPAPEHTDAAEEVAPREEISAEAIQTLPEALAAITEETEDGSGSRPVAEEIVLSPAATPVPEEPTGDADVAPQQEANAGAEQKPSAAPARSKRKKKRDDE